MEVLNFRKNDALGSSCEYHYNNNAFLARGRFGIVYEGTITKGGDYVGETKVAVKVTHLYRESEHYDDVDSWRRLRDRWTTLLGIRNIHLIKYHKVTISTSTGGASVEFLMEYCNGGDLASLLNSVRDSHEGIEFFRPNKILCYALQISEGLEFLHNHQIIHGDLKPANVLRHCTADGHDRILIGDLDDFTQMHHSVTSSYDIPTLRGSIRYLSPEMLKKFGGMPTASPGRVTDIWSFGCILHELLNCGYGVDKRVLHATLLSPENTLIPHYFHMLKNINDNVFVMTVLNGYAPFISELVPSIFREFLEKKLFVNSNRRFTASDVKNALLKIAWKLYPSFTQWRELDDNSVCFCRNTSSHGNPPPSNLKNNILFVHKLKQSGETIRNRNG